MFELRQTQRRKLRALFPMRASIKACKTTNVALLEFGRVHLFKFPSFNFEFKTTARVLGEFELVEFELVEFELVLCSNLYLIRRPSTGLLKR